MGAAVSLVVDEEVVEGMLSLMVTVIVEMTEVTFVAIAVASVAVTTDPEAVAVCVTVTVPVAICEQAEEIFWEGQPAMEVGTGMALRLARATAEAAGSAAAGVMTAP